MRYWVHFSALLLASLAFAQSKTTQYTTDLSGHRVPDAFITSSGAGQKTQLSQSINGRLVPLQQTETRVLSEGPGQRVTETITRYYDATGQLATTERAVSQEQKGPGGQSTVKATLYRSDLQGRMIETERREIQSKTQGSTTVSDVSVNRPTLNGTFETTEKRKVTTVTDGNVTKETDALLLPAPGGQFTERSRAVKQTESSDGAVKETAANYELNYAGRMEMMRSQASISRKAADGSQTTEVNIYAIASDFNTRDEQGGPPKIKEQQIIVQKPQPDGSVVATTSVRRPTMADQSKLGSPTKILETVCTGKCDGAPAAKETAPAPATQAQK